MKPLKLRMTAFGSYAGETVIPFSELDHGLYLVTGDTGAGKTTIFDAIVFALYGVASGSDRSAAMLHCDYVPRSQDTVVELDFAQGDKEYRVRRSIHFSRKRGTENEYGSAKFDAVLTEPDHEPTEGATAVSSRCTELLGINQDQFRKIIMLAQGEFMQFLRSDSDGKMEILSKLFDNTRYVYYQSLLMKARDMLKARRSSANADLGALMESVFIRPDDNVDYDPSMFIPGNPELEDNIRRLIEAEESDLEKHAASCSAADEEINRLNTEKGTAQEVNRQLDMLSDLRNRMDKLAAQEEEYAIRRERARRAEMVWRRIRPARTELNRTEQAYKRNQDEIAELKNQIEMLGKELDEALRAASGDEELRKEISEINAQVLRAGEQLHVYEEVDKKAGVMASAESAAEKAAGAAREKRVELEKLDGKITECRSELSELGDIDARVVMLEGKYSAAEKQFEILSGRDGILKKIKVISSDGTGLDKKRLSLMELTHRAGDAAHLHNSMYQKFIAGQAGLIAEGIRRELETSDEAICPVCGSVVGKARAAGLAGLNEDTPDEAAVNAARAAADALEKERRSLSEEVISGEAELEGRKNAVLKDAKEILENCSGWDMLNDKAYIAAEKGRIESARDAAHEELESAEKLREERNLLRDNLPLMEERRKELTESIRESEEESARQNLISREAAAVIEEKKKSLIYPDRKAAEDNIRLMKEKTGMKEGILKAHEEELRRIREAVSADTGKLEEKDKLTGSLDNERNAAAKTLKEELAKCRFGSIEETETLMKLIGDSDGEEWIERENSAIEAFNLEVHSTREHISGLEKQTGGRAYTDIAEIDVMLDDAGSRKKDADSRRNAAESLVKNHRMVLERAGKLIGELQQTDAAWSRISRLAGLAEGESGEGGKLSFDRYVMGAIFREVLVMANRRMGEISGGRYELVHVSNAGRKNARAGLEIEVFDNNTGQQRSSDSLSGGEKFFTSLSLALGLSDVVQNHAGGRQMESMFIDEGFGTLSDDVLDKAIGVLDQLTQGNRQVGVISHVDKLEESISQKIRVMNGERGSKVSVVLA